MTGSVNKPSPDLEFMNPNNWGQCKNKLPAPSMHTIEQHIVAEAKELCASQRWQFPDTPGSAQIEALGARLASPEMYGAFRSTAEGEYLLSLIEAYEAALNDDWLPVTLAGLPLEKAREFIHAVATALEKNPLPIAVQGLRAYYSQLAQP